jgi:NAD(P)-dependent dehydrogenase (short-subunit alcohol dehydrogenase family)
MNSTKKRVALVTGANRGIGFEIARQLAQKDMTLLLGARDEKSGLDARDRLSTQKLDVHFLPIDVSNQTSIQAAIGKVEDTFGRLDVLVNNAGIMIDGQTRILELSLSMFQNTLETNVLGPLLLSQACIPLMKANGYGRIVNVSSTLGSLNDIINPDSSYVEVQAPAYRLSKTVLNGLTVLLAKELRGTNILVNAVCPGWVHTRMGGDEAPVAPAEAAETPVWLATLPDEGPTGGFFRQRRPIPW